MAISLEGKKRAVEKMLATCKTYVQTGMRKKLAGLFPQCEIIVDEDVEDGQALRVNFPSILPPDGYQTPWVMLECGARGALEPDAERSIAPFIQDAGTDRQRASRHYYDLAMMFDGPIGQSAVKKKHLLGDVCEHSRLGRFSRAWQKLGEAKPGSLRVAPPKNS